MKAGSMVRWMSILVVALINVSCSCPEDVIKVRAKAPLDWYFVSTEPVDPLYNAYQLQIIPPTRGLFPASIGITRVESEVIDESVDLIKPLIFTNPRNEYLKWNSTFDDLMAISEVFPVTQFDMGGENAYIENILGAFRALGANLGLVYAVNEFDDLETEIIGSLYDTETTRPIAHFHAHAVSVFPEKKDKDKPINLWKTDSTAIARDRFESLVYACILELIEHDERAVPHAPPGWKPVGPARRVKWPPIAGLSNH